MPRWLPCARRRADMRRPSSVKCVNSRPAQCWRRPRTAARAWWICWWAIPCPGSVSGGMATMAANYGLYGTERCPYTREMRDWLEFRGCDFVEYDVENDPAALDRMKALAGGQRAVPVLVEAGRVVEIGWQGRSCIV